jgi:hypothetical protein
MMAGMVEEGRALTVTTTPPVTRLVAWFPGRQSHPRQPNTREMERLAPHAQISSAPSKRGHSPILRCPDANNGYQVVLGVSLRPPQRCPVPPLAGQRTRAWLVSPSVCSYGRCERSTIAFLCSARVFDPPSPLLDCISLHSIPNMTLASRSLDFQNALPTL